MPFPIVNLHFGLIIVVNVSLIMLILMWKALVFNMINVFHIKRIQIVTLLIIPILKIKNVFFAKKELLKTRMVFVRFFILLDVSFKNLDLDKLILWKICQLVCICQIKELAVINAIQVLWDCTLIKKRLYHVLSLLTIQIIPWLLIQNIFISANITKWWEENYYAKFVLIIMCWV